MFFREFLRSGLAGHGDLEFPACPAAVRWNGSWNCRKRSGFCGFWALSVAVVGSEVPYVRRDGVGTFHVYLQPQEFKSSREEAVDELIALGGGSEGGCGCFFRDVYSSWLLNLPLMHCVGAKAILIVADIFSKL